MQMKFMYSLSDRLPRFTQEERKLLMALCVKGIEFVVKKFHPKVFFCPTLQDKVIKSLKELRKSRGDHIYQNSLYQTINLILKLKTL